MDFEKKKALVLGVILYHKERTLEELREAFVSEGTMTEKELQKCLETLTQEGRIKKAQPGTRPPREKALFALAQ